jgi:nucleoside-diphosphate-sugar epimerase/catechol 2,3-dioxygenase-like lactoylglutathione lyase family enzyme
VKVLYVGGTGVISTACVRRSIALGHEVSVLNRGTHPAPEGARQLKADIRDAGSVEAALGGAEFDVVAEFLAFTPEHVQADVDRFAGRIGQYVFISSASAYQTPPARLPITESTPLRNPFWPYSRAKIACEDLLVREYRERGFPMTIVRPSHTYDRTLVPYDTGWTTIDRMRRGKPVVVHGDGTALWTLTHSDDFATGFTGLLGHPQAIGDSFHITGDEAPTWNAIFEMLAAAAGARARIVHVPSETILLADEAWGTSLLGDKAHCALFDNAKLRTLVPGFRATIPFARGAEEIVAWHDATGAQPDPATDALLDRLTGGPIALDHCVIHVSDWERANAFYGDVLGAEVIPRGAGFAYRLGDRQLNVHGPGVDAHPLARDPVRPGNSDLCFRWHGPIEEAIAHLEAHGVEVELGPVPRAGALGEGTSVYFRDPDGSLMELIAYRVDA